MSFGSFSAPGYAQTLGTITGEVKDQSNATIPGATVTAQNVATNAVRTQTSNEAGVYTFSAMPPGMYQVKAELQGFRTVQNNVELHVEETLRVNFTLEVGTISETTEVSAAVTLISTENATVGTVIENRRIVELPLNGRNYLSLIALSPNVSAGFAGAGQAGDRQGGSRANQQISISGQRREFNYYTLDGVDNFNNPVWGDPNLSMANPTLFGTINTTRTPMRELQIGGYGPTKATVIDGGELFGRSR